MYSGGRIVVETCYFYRASLESQPATALPHQDKAEEARDTNFEPGSLQIAVCRSGMDTVVREW